jgi:hypothetical protein
MRWDHAPSWYGKTKKSPARKKKITKKKATRKNPPRRRRKATKKLTPLQAWRQATVELLGVSEKEVKKYIVSTRHPSGWASEGDLAIIFLEPQGGRWDTGRIPDLFSYPNQDETLLFKIEKRASSLSGIRSYVDYVNAAVAVATRA